VSGRQATESATDVADPPHSRMVGQVITRIPVQDSIARDEARSTP
jgi:hypothetical protein